MKLKRFFFDAVNLMRRGWTSALPPRLRHVFEGGRDHHPMMGRLRKMRRRVNRQGDVKTGDVWMRLRTQDRLNRGPHTWFESRLTPAAVSPRARTFDGSFSGQRLHFEEDLAAMRADLVFTAASQAISIA